MDNFHDFFQSKRSALDTSLRNDGSDVWVSSSRCVTLLFQGPLDVWISSFSFLDWRITLSSKKTSSASKQFASLPPQAWYLWFVAALSGLEI